ADDGHRSAPPMVPARGARLPNALCGSLVNGGSVDRLSALEPPPTSRADLAGELRRLHITPGSGTNARAAKPPPRLAICRGSAHRRSDASADTPRGWALRREAPQSERRPATSRRPMEVRIQRHQIDREDPLDRTPASDDVEQRRPKRIRLLRQT